MAPHSRTADCRNRLFSLGTLESITPQPIALSICKESRREIEKLYPICFGTILQSGCIRFNYDIDILYLSKELGGDTRRFLDRLQEKGLRGLKNLAYHRDMLGKPRVRCVDVQRLEGALEAAIRAMTGLTREIIVEDMSNTRDANGLEYTHRELGNMEFYSTWEIDPHDDTTIRQNSQYVRDRGRDWPKREVELMFGMRKPPIWD